MIVLQESLRAVFYAPFYAALALGAYAEEGVEVGFASAPSPGAAARSLFDGKADVTWGGPMRVMETYAIDPACDLVCFGEAVTRDPFMLVGATPPPADFTLADLAALRLATVAEVPTPWMCLQADIRRAGLDPWSVTRVADRWMGENVVALGRGDVDLVQLFEPYVSELAEKGRGHIWYAAATRGPTSYTTFYARRPVLAARRDELGRMVRALHRTLKWVHASDPARLADVIARWFPDVPKPRLTAALARYGALGIWGRDPRLPRGGYERLKESLISGGFVPKGLPYETCVDNGLADASVASDPPPLVG
jgi:NitT/TauT family transport system substrate-binding protein